MTGNLHVSSDVYLYSYYPCQEPTQTQLLLGIFENTDSKLLLLLYFVARNFENEFEAGHTLQRG